MDILIRGMEMPTSCATCKLFGEYGCPFVGAVTYALTRGKRHKDCPLIPVPEHGRLGDLDKLENNLRHMAKYQYGERQQGILGCCETIRSAPTVVPAEET